MEYRVSIEEKNVKLFRYGNSFQWFNSDWEIADIILDKKLLIVKKYISSGYKYRIVCFDGSMLYEAFDNISYSSGIIHVVSGNGSRHKFMNTKLDKITDTEFCDAHDFCDEMACVKNKNGLWGYIDKSGKQVIGFKYKYASDFFDGFALVSEYNSDTSKCVLMVIDKNGNTVRALQSRTEENKFDEEFRTKKIEYQRKSKIRKDSLLNIGTEWFLSEPVPVTIPSRWVNDSGNDSFACASMANGIPEIMDFSSKDFFGTCNLLGNNTAESWYGIKYKDAISVPANTDSFLRMERSSGFVPSFKFSDKYLINEGSLLRLKAIVLSRKAYVGKVIFDGDKYGETKNNIGVCSTDREGVSALLNRVLPVINKYDSVYDNELHSELRTLANNSSRNKTRILRIVRSNLV